MISTLMLQSVFTDSRFPYSPNLFSKLCSWRNQHNSLVGRMSTEFALIGVTLLNLTEMTFFATIILLLATCSKKHSLRSFKDFGQIALMYTCGQFYALILNLFVRNITSVLIDL